MQEPNPVLIDLKDGKPAVVGTNLSRAAYLVEIVIVPRLNVFALYMLHHFCFYFSDPDNDSAPLSTTIKVRSSRTWLHSKNIPFDIPIQCAYATGVDKNERRFFLDEAMYAQSHWQEALVTRAFSLEPY